jgi:tetratricopeptide (TPR) repeat protein
MFYLDPKFDTKSLQREMDRAFHAAAMRVPDDSTFDLDLRALRALYKESGYAKARTKFEAISSKWASHMSPQEQVKLLKTIARIAAVDTKFDQAQQFYLDALGVQPKNVSLMLSKAECYMAEGNIAEARSWFRRAFYTRQDINTAAKYGELLYLAGEGDEIIKTIINPVLGHSISTPIPTRSEVTIITLHLLTRSDSKSRQSYEFMMQQAAFKNPQSVLNKIRDLAKLWSAIDRAEAMRWMASDRIKRGFGREHGLSEMKREDVMKEEQLDAFSRKILRAYKGSNDLFTDPHERRPVNRDAARAAGKFRSTKP